MKKALITGALGQDGSYLAELLLAKGYEVHGISRGVIGLEECHYVAGVKYHVADLRDEIALENTFRKVWPDEVYNLAAQVFVPTSWSIPAETFDVNVGGLSRILKIVDNWKSDTKIYQASSSEMFGNQNGALDESTPLKPVSPYGASKAAAHQLAHVYRDKGLFVVCGILFNHESPRRGEHMVTRKITKHVAKWSRGDNDPLRLGRGDSTRDWGHAKDYVEGMWEIMQHPTPDDFVICTGESHTVYHFVQEAMEAAHVKSKKVIYGTPEFTRNNELYHLKACAKKAYVALGWEPKISFKELVWEMINADIKALGGNVVFDEAECTN